MTTHDHLLQKETKTTEQWADEARELADTVKELRIGDDGLTVEFPNFEDGTGRIQIFRGDLTTVIKTQTTIDPDEFPRYTRLEIHTDDKSEFGVVASSEFTSPNGHKVLEAAWTYNDGREPEGFSSEVREKFDEASDGWIREPVTEESMDSERMGSFLGNIVENSQRAVEIAQANS